MGSDWHVLSLFGLAGIADSDPKRAKRDQSGEASGSWTVSPTELREALSGLGKAAIRFELSEMHDASEVRHQNHLWLRAFRVYFQNELHCTCMMLVTERHAGVELTRHMS